MPNDEPKFDSWRENLDRNQEETRDTNQGAQPQKSVDGMGHFVSKEGFVIDEKDQTSNQKLEQQPSPQPNHQAQTTPPPFGEQIKKEVSPPPPPPGKTVPPSPESKKGFPGWLKAILWIVIALIVLGGIYLLFFYKSTLEVAVSVSDININLDSQNISAGINKVRPGKYTIQVDKDGYVPYAKEVEVKYFKKTSLSIVLKETPKIISIYDKQANYLAYNKEYDFYLFYVPAESAFYRVDASKFDQERNSPTLISPHYVKNVVDVVWNPDRLTAILKIKNDNAQLSGTPFYNPKIADGTIMAYLYDFGRYDLLHQEAQFWSTGIGDIEFTPKGDQVAYYFEPGTGEKSLVIANKDNSSINRILDLRSFVNPLLSWSPDLKNIIIVNRSSTFDTNKIYIFNLIDKTLNQVTDFGQNIEARFNFNGAKIVYSTYSSDPDFTNYSLLSVMDRDGKNKKELKLRSYIPQTTLNATGELLALTENEKDNYSLVSVNLADLKNTQYSFSGKIIAPTSIEYIEAKNSIIFIDQGKAELLFLTTNEYE